MRPDEYAFLRAAEAARDRALAEVEQLRDGYEDFAVDFAVKVADRLHAEAISPLNQALAAARSRIADLEATVERVRALAVEAESVGGPGSSFVLAALESDVALANGSVPDGGV